MSVITITHEPGETKGRYIAHVDGQTEPGELTYTRTSTRLIIVDHTGVPDSLRGQGVGAALAAHVVDEARRGGFKIIPLCPFFKAQVARHPDWANVIQ